MDGLSKAFDSIIKAPLWAFFAVAFAASLPLLGIPVLVDLGVKRDFALAGIPLALVAVLFWSLFLASGLARSSAWVWENLSPVFADIGLGFRLANLSLEARTILAFMEDEDNHVIYHRPNDAGVRQLKDKGYLVADYVDTNGEWAKLEMTDRINRQMFRHRVTFRRALHASPEDIAVVKAIDAKIRHRNRF